MKRSLTLVLAIIVLCGLFGTWFLLKSRNEKAKEQEEQTEEGTEILNMPEENVSAVSFSISGETCTFSREDGSWKMEGEDHFTGDDEAFASLLGYFDPLRATRTLEEIEDISEYGLDDPVNTFTLITSDGTKTSLVIGNNNEGTGDDYAMIKGEESVVYTISASLKDSVGEDPCDYALEETLPSVLTDSLLRVEIHKDEEETILSKESGSWVLEDTADALDQDAVEDALSALNQISYSDYVTWYCSDPSQYGLDSENRIRIAYVSYTDSALEGQDSSESASEKTDMGETESEKGTESDAEPVSELSFIIGKQDDSGNYYVQREGSDEVHTISASVIDSLYEIDTKNLKETQTDTEAEADADAQAITEADKETYTG